MSVDGFRVHVRISVGEAVSVLGFSDSSALITEAAKAEVALTVS